MFSVATIMLCDKLVRYLFYQQYHLHQQARVGPSSVAARVRKRILTRSGYRVGEKKGKYSNEGIMLERES